MGHLGTIFSFDRTLIGNREPPDLFNLVTEELDAQCRIFGGRKDVDNAPSDGELSPSRHHVDARIRQM